jgi:GrpB-like predicted nucleotidyltransferase (UPF0157 family)
MPVPAVILAAYDESWPRLFDAEAGSIESVCVGLPIRLEHIGSTAVPGLSGKPVIDILAGRPPQSRAEPYIAALRQIGYEHKGAFGVPGREYFRRGSPRTHHVHLVRWSSALWADYLAFRDALREDAGLRRDYDALKRDLAIAFANEKRGYAEAKGPFIRSVLRDAARKA